MKRNITTSLFIAIAGATLFLLTGCSTVEGVGKDVESLGEEVQDAAN